MTSFYDPKFSKIYCDSAIDEAKNFNFDAYSVSISNIILNPKNTTPFCIAINGKWGSGKTSLMRTIRSFLHTKSTESNNRKVRSVWFNAWKYRERDSLLAALIQEIYDELERESIFVKGGLKNRILMKSIKINERANITQQITDLAKILTLGMGPDLTKWQKTPAYEQHLAFYDKFQKYIQLILKIFVLEEFDAEYDDSKGVLAIFIDDLDRCPPNVITDVLESINLFFDQKGCIFILGMDVNLITDAISSRYTDYKGFSGKDYIKKMIQLQFDLPEIREQDIRDYIEKELIVDDPLHKYINLVIIGAENNPRRIKQFINSLNFILTLGNFIKGLHIDEELLVKWSILNLISSEFINEIKTQKRLLISVQAYCRLDRESMDHEEFMKWVDEYDREFYLFASKAEKETYNHNFSKFVSDKKIFDILQNGDREFTEQNLADYIFLSSIAPKEAKVTIITNKETIILGNPISFSGTCINNGDTVHLVLFGPGQYSNGIEIASPEVSSSNNWNYEWSPGYSIQPGLYTIHVYDIQNAVSDKLTFTVKKGEITITYSGPGTYYLGETINFEGTSTAGTKVYLSIAFPNPQLNNRKIDQMIIETINNDVNTFVEIEVNDENIWRYKWDTSKIAPRIDAGTYTIYANEGPFTKNNLENRAYATASIVLKKPFVAASISQNKITRGDPLYIRGTAEGHVSLVQIWIFGETFYLVEQVPVKADASFEYKLTKELNQTLKEGQYLVIIQHPMLNNEFDVYPDPTTSYVMTNYPKKGTGIFSLKKGNEYKQGVSSAYAVMNALNFGNVDDTYTTLSFNVENPRIKIDDIGDKKVGDTFKITGTTNLLEGRPLKFTILAIIPVKYPGIQEISEEPKLVTEGVVTIQRGDIYNTFSGPFDSKNCKPGTYRVQFGSTDYNIETQSDFELTE